MELPRSGTASKAGCTPASEPRRRTFPNRLAPAGSDLAQQSTCDTVLLDCLGLADPVHEQAVEDAMMDDLTRTMLELGDGLAFVGRQVPLRVGDHEFTADLSDGVGWR